VVREQELGDGQRFCALALPGPAEACGQPGVGATPPFDAAAGRVRLLLGEGVTGWVASHGEPVTITDHKEADPRYRYFPELRGGEFTSMASVPMASRPAGLAGVLNVHTRSRRIFAERDVVLLTAIGSLFAGVVHQARLHRRLAAREHALERFAQEALQNVVKHAGASGASVELRCDPGLVSLRITDDGAGFYPGAATPGFGLSGMAERAELVGGRLDVRSGPGRGTTIEARIPVTPPS
jgi:two-component system, NarL family, sensor kinase